MNRVRGLCCCFQDPAPEEERQPILGPAQTARQSHFTPNAFQDKEGRITVRHVDVPDLDQRFTDLAETFNKQQENYKCMQKKWKTLMSSYKVDTKSSLSECLQKIKDEHKDHQISLQMKGYDFCLTVTPVDPIPDKLKQTQESIKELCQAVKAIMALGPKLEQLITWLLKSEESLTQLVNREATTHQESIRLGGNLRKNLSEVSRAKELSPFYREEAGKLFNEVAVLSGVEL